ncbi:uncharacterized protein Nmag_3719 (plasmid) [Natrialba magadii ATCC 43099]|uniref:Uncharacterized protein n=1 Tax=Natrialba magadii (strain ATCC 43099 / DSM 3394 / CCM 3739 / CIP 104546 / IAM 13178 / JCM 8861 / NBRC 102185 / NCIMB 2190 / MS3) TaxID=547559 RepID=D3T102_NATMM|nr:uncharacterized protein Nmag_3719 [Natrialba magadii ATCC 43099]
MLLGTEHNITAEYVTAIQREYLYTLWGYTVAISAAVALQKRVGRAASELHRETIWFR